MASEPRTLSSPATFGLKFVLPIVFGAGFGAATLLQFLTPSNAGAQYFQSDRLEWLGVTVVGTALLWMWHGPLKRVRMDGTALHISNYRKEITVPLTEVADVSEVWSSFRVITVTFRVKTAFGWTIDFVPEARWGTLLGSPPVADEVRAAAARCTGKHGSELPPN